MRHIIALLVLTFLSGCTSNGVGSAATGLSWKRFDSFGLSVQVPSGWHTQTTSSTGTRGLQITKEPVTGGGFETGLTINLIERSSEAEFKSAILQTGAYMAKLHDSCSQVIASSTSEPQGIPTMILEGVRMLPGQAGRGLYHTRTIVHIFKPTKKIYVVIFGSPAKSWSSEYATGKKLLNPIQFDALKN